MTPEQDELHAALIEQGDFGTDHLVSSHLGLHHAGPYQGGALPPVRNSLRFFSARSSSGRWISEQHDRAARNM